MIQGKQLERTPPEQRGYMKKVFMDFYDENMTSPYVAAERGYVGGPEKKRPNAIVMIRTGDSADSNAAIYKSYFFVLCAR